MLVDHAPDRIDRHLLGQRHNQRFKQQRKTAAQARPRHFHHPRATVQPARDVTGKSLDGATLFVIVYLATVTPQAGQLGSLEHHIKVDVRIIAATNRNLEEEVHKGRFREDLWYRLNIFPITVPPLRDRLSDISLLVNFYVNKISKRLGKSIEMIPFGVIDALQEYHWPGNIRELENVLERGVISSSGPKLRLVDDLTKTRSKHQSMVSRTLEDVEREYIVRVLEQVKWKVSGKNSAADILGLNRSTLRARMNKLNIRKDRSI